MIFLLLWDLVQNEVQFKDDYSFCKLILATYNACHTFINAVEGLVRYPLKGDGSVHHICSGFTFQRRLYLILCRYKTLNKVFIECIMFLWVYRRVPHSNWAGYCHSDLAAMLVCGWCVVIVCHVMAFVVM